VNAVNGIEKYKTALIVEDSPTMRQLLVYAVGLLDLETVEASDGVDALKKLSEITPDIILADINMPVMDGLKLVKRVRADERLNGIPIVIITTEGAEEDRERALALGANAFVTKPIQAPQVVDLVRSLLEPAETK
jgi:two-component system chemotaxis response regulator CheY